MTSGALAPGEPVEAVRRAGVSVSSALYPSFLLLLREQKAPSYLHQKLLKFDSVPIAI